MDPLLVIFLNNCPQQSSHPPRKTLRVRSATSQITFVSNNIEEIRKTYINGDLERFRLWFSANTLLNMTEKEYRIIKLSET